MIMLSYLLKIKQIAQEITIEENLKPRETATYHDTRLLELEFNIFLLHLNM